MLPGFNPIWDSFALNSEINLYFFGNQLNDKIVTEIKRERCEGGNIGFFGRKCEFNETRGFSLSSLIPNSRILKRVCSYMGWYSSF